MDGAIRLTNDGRVQVRGLVSGVLIALVTTTFAATGSVTETRELATQEVTAGGSPSVASLSSHHRLAAVAASERRAAQIRAKAQARREARAVTQPAETAGPTEEQWANLRDCESAGDYRINTGNGYYGAYQFDLTTWRGVGGTGYPHQASPGEQDKRAQILYRMRGAQPWPTCGAYLP